MFGVMSRRNCGQTSKSALLVESHRMCLLPSAVSCDSYCLPGKPLETVLRFFFVGGGWEGLFTEPPSTLALTKIPGSQKENRCSTQTILFAQFSHSEPLLPFLGIELSRNLSFPRSALQTALSKDSTQACCVHSFPVHRCLFNSLKINAIAENQQGLVSDRPGFVLL